MKRNILIAAILVGIAALVWTPAGSASIRKSLKPNGPYPVGVRLVKIAYEGKELPGLVWYPAKPAAGAKGYKYRSQHAGGAVLDAPLDAKAAPYPLILFSHGLGGCASQSVFYTENLASFGYVVVAPDHQDSAMCHTDRDPDIKPLKMGWLAVKSRGDLSKTVLALFGDKLKDNGFDFSYRPAEAKAAIDQALAWNADPASFLKGAMDSDKIGVAGHSLGGYTSLMVGGVPFLCDQPEDKNPTGCDFSKLSLDKTPSPCCLDYVRKADPYASRDPRIKAMLPLGPAAFFPHLDRAAAEIKIPVMVISGDNKKMEVPWPPIQELYDHAPAPKYAVRLQHTDHMTIADMTLNVHGARLVLPGFRRHFALKAAAYKDYSVAFFNKFLKGDNSGEATLTKPENKFVELQAKEK